MGKDRDLTGQRFGRLIAIRQDEPIKSRITWLCKCDCGNEKVVREYTLIYGSCKSCGCLQKESMSERMKVINVKHGHSYSRIYKTYRDMKRRCYNKNYKRYKDWGGRGITICKEWLDKENGFTNFYDWAMGNGYAEELTLDRKDNDGNYEPDNCRWVTHKEQSRNISTNRVYKGKCIKEWCEELDLRYSKVISRINRLKWTIEEALELVPKKRYMRNE